SASTKERDDETSPTRAATQPVSTEVPVREASPAEDSRPGAWWFQTAGAQALGTMAGLILGLVISLVVAHLIIRRQAARPDPVVRVELIQSPSSDAYGSTLRLHAAGGPAPHGSDRELGAVEFADVNVPLPPPGGTWHDRHEAELRAKEEAEQAIV